MSDLIFWSPVILAGAAIVVALTWPAIRARIVDWRLRRTAPEIIRTTEAMTDAELAELPDDEFDRRSDVIGQARTVYRGGLLLQDPALKDLHARLDAVDTRRRTARAAAREAAQSERVAQARHELGL